MSRYLLSILGLGFALLTACTEPKEPASLTEPSYFDLEEVLNAQIQKLQNAGAGATKTTHTSGAKTLRKLNWTHELDIFRQGSINRPAWRREFETDTTLLGDNYSVHYRRKSDSNTTVKWLKADFSKQGSPTQIEAVVENDNMLFSTQKHLSLQFDKESGLLEKYEVKGQQKMILSDKQQYELTGRVRL